MHDCFDLVLFQNIPDQLPVVDVSLIKRGLPGNRPFMARVQIVHNYHRISRLYQLQNCVGTNITSATCDQDSIGQRFFRKYGPVPSYGAIYGSGLYGTQLYQQSGGLPRPDGSDDAPDNHGGLPLHPAQFAGTGPCACPVGVRGFPFSRERRAVFQAGWVSVFIRQQHEEVIAKSEFAITASSLVVTVRSSFVSFLWRRHSANPCNAHTLSG